MMNNKIILGTVQMGLRYGINNTAGKISFQDSHAILKEAYLSGIRFLDTAEAYGDAHRVIGDFHRANPDLVFNVITKIPSTENFTNIEKKVGQYLADLKVKQLEALMFHAFGAYKKCSEIAILSRLKKEGFFRQLGVSIYTNAELKELIDDPAVDVIQLPFNLLDNASLRGALLREAKLKNKTIHTRSVFLQGLFFKDPSDSQSIVRSLQKQLLEIHQLANEKHASIADLSLSYCMQQKNIDQVLIGVDSVQHLKTNIEAGKYQIDTETVERIDQIHTENIDLLNPALWH